jgi:hypothetical protein
MPQYPAGFENLVPQPTPPSQSHVRRNVGIGGTALALLGTAVTVIVSAGHALGFSLSRIQLLAAFSFGLALLVIGAGMLIWLAVGDRLKRLWHWIPVRLRSPIYAPGHREGQSSLTFEGGLEVEFKPAPTAGLGEQPDVAERYQALLAPLGGKLLPGSPRAAVFDHVVRVAQNSKVRVDVVELHAVVENMYQATRLRDAPKDWFEVRPINENGRPRWEVRLEWRAQGLLVRDTEDEAEALKKWLRTLMAEVRELSSQPHPTPEVASETGSPVPSEQSTSNQQLAADLAEQRRLVEEHSAKLEPVIGPRPSAASSPRGTAERLTGPPIPIPPYVVRTRVQSPDVFIAIVNGDAIATYRGQVVEVGGAREDPAVPWSIPWRDGSGLETQIAAPGETRLLRLGTGDGMGDAASYSQSGGIHFALFHLHTVHGGPVTVEPPTKAGLSDFATRDHLFEIQLRIYCDDTGTDFMVRLGFVNEKDATGNIKVSASIADWDNR